MKIGIDLDDTLTDIQDELLKEALKYDKTLENKGIVNPNKVLITEKFAWSNSNRKYFLKNIRKEVVEQAKLRPDTLIILNELKKRGYEIIIITARSSTYYEDPYEFTLKYLIKNKIPFDKLIVNGKDKVKVCKMEQINFFIDNNLTNCLNVSKLGVKVFFLNIGFYKDVFTSKNIKIIYSLKEILKYIK